MSIRDLSMVLGSVVIPPEIRAMSSVAAVVLALLVVGHLLSQEDQNED